MGNLFLFFILFSFIELYISQNVIIKSEITVDGFSNLSVARNDKCRIERAPNLSSLGACHHFLFLFLYLIFQLLKHTFQVLSSQQTIHCECVPSPKKETQSLLTLVALYEKTLHLHVLAIPCYPSHNTQNKTSFYIQCFLRT